MDNLRDKVDTIEGIRISGDMVVTVYHVLQKGIGKYLLGNRPVSETNEPDDLLVANQFETDEIGLLFKKWRNERFGSENLGNVAITKQDFKTLKHYFARQMATAVLQSVWE